MMTRNRATKHGNTPKNKPAGKSAALGKPADTTAKLTNILIRALLSTTCHVIAILVASTILGLYGPRFIHVVGHYWTRFHDYFV